MKRMSKLQLALSVLLMLCLLAGCGAKSGDSKAAEQALTDEEIFGAPPEESPGVELETPYITLYYPEEWKGLVNISQQGSDSSYILSFSADFSGEDVELFSIIFSSGEHEGYLMGTLKDKSIGKINVYTLMNQSVSGMSDEDYGRFCSMQERVNDFIMQLHEDARFKATK